MVLRIILTLSLLLFDQTNAAMNRNLREEFLKNNDDFANIKINPEAVAYYVNWLETQVVSLRTDKDFYLEREKARLRKNGNRELIEQALSAVGIEEIKGRKSNPFIMEMFKVTGKDWVKDDATAWCSAYVNWVAICKGYEASREINARSWLKVGEPIEKDCLEIGDVMIFWRESRSSWKGHVAFYISEDEENYNVLGGNQGDTVKIAPYPKRRFLGARRLKKL